MTENYYKEFYSSEFVNTSLGGDCSPDSDSEEDDFIIAGQNVSYQDSNSST